MEDLRLTKKEFANQCVKRGYVSFADGGSRAVLKWCKTHPKEFYTEADMLEVYRYFDAKKFGGRPRTETYDNSWTRDPM